MSRLDQTGRVALRAQRRSLLRGSLVAPLGLAGAFPAWAQTAPFPAKAMQFVVGSPAGGGVDVTARKLADGVGALLGHNMLVVNRPGAAGLLAAQVVSTAPPDGHTLGYVHSGHLILQAMEGKPDLPRDFSPILRVTASQFCIAVASDSPYRSLGDLLSAMARNPGKLNYGAGGNGSPGHIAFEKLVMMRPGLVAVQIPFKGAVESVLAVAQKEIDFVSGLLSSVFGVARSGKVRILAVTGAQRSPTLPDVPTVAEAASLPGYEYMAWGGVAGPARVPRDRVLKLEAAFRRVASSEEFRKFLSESGGQSVLSESPASFAADIRRELAETSALMKRLGLQKT